jgi:SulP family sulfate permease
MYFVQSGKVSVWTESPGEEPRRLRSLGPGTTVGEVGLYLGAARTATVRADEPTSALRISREALDTMRRQNPGLLASFHEMIARQLSEWVVQGDRGLRALRG